MYWPNSWSECSSSASRVAFVVCPKIAASWQGGAAGRFLSRACARDFRNINEGGWHQAHHLVSRGQHQISVANGVGPNNPSIQLPTNKDPSQAAAQPPTAAGFPRQPALQASHLRPHPYLAICTWYILPPTTLGDSDYDNQTPYKLRSLP